MIIFVELTAIIQLLQCIYIYIYTNFPYVNSNVFLINEQNPIEDNYIFIRLRLMNLNRSVVILSNIILTWRVRYCFVNIWCFTIAFNVYSSERGNFVRNNFLTAAIYHRFEIRNDRTTTQMTPAEQWRALRGKNFRNFPHFFPLESLFLAGIMRNYIRFFSLRSNWKQ